MEKPQSPSDDRPPSPVDEGPCTPPEPEDPDVILWRKCRASPGTFENWVGEPTKALIPYLEKASTTQEHFQPALVQAYEEFLVEFPLCYGYWHKLAKLQYTLEGGEAAINIYERGLQAVNSLELYMHYCQLMSDMAGPPNQQLTVGSSGGDVFMQEPSEGETRAREVFLRAIADQGSEWLSEKLWDKFVKFEESRGGHMQEARVAKIHLMAALQPTSSAYKFMASFLKIIDVGDVENVIRGATIIDSAAFALPEEDLENIKSILDVNARKSALLTAAQKAHTVVLNEVSHRRRFEDKITRRYFHVEAMKKHQKLNWHQYIDDTMKRADEEGHDTGPLRDTVVRVFERCLIPCYLYVEYWEKYSAYLERRGDVSGARAVLHRACTSAFKARPDLKLYLALFEESQNDLETARSLYTDLLAGAAAECVEVIIRAANFERRVAPGEPGLAAAREVYRAALQRLTELYFDVELPGDAGDFVVASQRRKAALDLPRAKREAGKKARAFVAIHFATVLSQAYGKTEEGREVYQQALEYDGTNLKLLQAYVSMELSSADAGREERVREAYRKACELAKAADKGNYVTPQGVVVQSEPAEGEFSLREKLALHREFFDFEMEKGTNIRFLREATSLYNYVAAQAAPILRKPAKRPAETPASAGAAKHTSAYNNTAAYAATATAATANPYAAMQSAAFMQPPAYNNTAAYTQPSSAYSQYAHAAAQPLAAQQYAHYTQAAATHPGAYGAYAAAAAPAYAAGTAYVDPYAQQQAAYAHYAQYPTATDPAAAASQAYYAQYPAATTSAVAATQAYHQYQDPNAAYAAYAVDPAAAAAAAGAHQQYYGTAQQYQYQ